MTVSTLTPEGEDAWLRLKTHIEWTDGFLVGFIFCSHPLVVKIFRERLADIFRARITRLQFILPENPDQLADEILRRLIHPFVHELTHAGPFWIDLSGKAGPDWQKARVNFMARLNEHREPLRKHLGRPLVIILPADEKEQMRGMAPDLWAIRSFTLETKDSYLAPAKEIIKSDRSEVTIRRELTEYEQSVLNEWKRVQKTGSTAREILLAGDRAIKILMSSRSLKQADEIAQYLLQIARKNVSETPEGLRDLSISLNNVGTMAKELGQLEQARKCYEECLATGEKLATAFPDLPEYTKLPAYFSEKIAHLDKTS